MTSKMKNLINEMMQLVEEGEISEVKLGTAEKNLAKRVNAAQKLAREVTKSLSKIKAELAKGSLDNEEMQEFGALVSGVDSDLRDMNRKINGVIGGTMKA